jgi:hypothetical protein
VTRRRDRSLFFLPIELAGAAMREFLLPALRRLFDAMDPAGNTGQAWGPRAIVVPDYVPECLTREQR